MPEKFNLKKAVDLSPTAVGKVSSIGVKLLILAGIVFCIGFTLWQLFQPKQGQKIIIEKGGSAVIQQNQTNRRALVPFMEGFFEQSRNDKFNTGIRAGLRLEF